MSRRGSDQQHGAAVDQFKLDLNKKLEEMSRVSDIAAKFNPQPAAVGGKPPAPYRKLSTDRPPLSPKSPGVANGFPNPVKQPSVNLNHVRLKPVTLRKPDQPNGGVGPKEFPPKTDFRASLKPVVKKPVCVPKPNFKPTSIGPKPVPRKKPAPAPAPVSDDADRGRTVAEGDHSGSGSVHSNRSDGSDGDGTTAARLAILPPLTILGAAPKKPPKPPNVKLPPPTGINISPAFVPGKPGVPSRAPAPDPVPQPVVDDDIQEVYDDVEHPPILPSIANIPSLNKRISVIPCMDSDEEVGADDDQEMYDDTANIKSPSAKMMPTSGDSSSSSHMQTSGTSQNSGSGGDFNETYDPVDAEEDFDDVYEPVNVDEPTNIMANRPLPTPGPSPAPGDTEKDKEAERKREEKQRKEQEKLQKKDEERRKKEDREEKKRKEKADKDVKKKFKIKGEIKTQDLERGTAAEDVADENDKLGILCTKGEALEIIRRDGPNPTGKLLVRNELGQLGYIDTNLVRLADFDEVYDDVCGDSVAEEEGDFQDIYDMAE